MMMMRKGEARKERRRKRTIKRRGRRTWTTTFGTFGRRDVRNEKTTKLFAKYQGKSEIENFLTSENSSRNHMQMVALAFKYQLCI